MHKFTTPKGEEIVILPAADYERLVDTTDIAIAERVKSDIANGRDEFVPADIANRILDGENAVRVWRTFRDLTARDLADRTGLSAAYISEIETGRKDGSIAAFKKIAEALGVAVDDLI